MMTVDEILKNRCAVAAAKVEAPPSRSETETSEDRKKRFEFSCEKKYGKGEGASDGFRVKEEMERWGGRLSAAPRGFSGDVSGTRTVVDSMNFDRRLAAMDRKAKKDAEALRTFHDDFVEFLMPRFVKRFNSDGSQTDWSHEKVPTPCLDRGEAAAIAEFAKHSEWRKEKGFKELVVAALRHVIRYGNFKDEPISTEYRIFKARLVEAYHWFYRYSERDECDEWWKRMFDERKTKGEVVIPKRGPSISLYRYYG